MNEKKIITRNNRAVVINVQNHEDGCAHVWANLYVNARDGIMNADITPTRWEGKTLQGAERWAAKTLAQ